MISPVGDDTGCRLIPEDGDGRRAIPKRGTRRALRLAALMIALASLPAFALGDRVVIDQDSAGIVTAHLVGFIDACHGDHYFPMNPAAVNQTGTAFSVNAPFAIV